MKRLFQTSAFACIACILTHSSVLAQNRPAHKAAPSSPSKVPTELVLRLQLRDNPHDVQAHKQLNKLLREKYAFRSQMEEDGQWLRSNPDDYVAEIEMRSLADTAVSDPEYAIAVDRFVLAHASRQDDPLHYDNVSDRLARALLNRGQTTEAIAIMKKQTELSPEDSGVWENLADGQVATGQIEAGVASYKRAISLDGNQEAPHEGLADAYSKAGNYHAAATELTAALAIYNAQYHGAAPSDSYHSAMKQMQDITHMEPNLIQLHRKLARVYVAEKDYTTALQEADKASRPDDPYGDYYLRASIYDASGDTRKAAETRANAHTEVITLLEPQISTGRLKPMDLMLLGISYCSVDRIPECKQQSRAAMSLSKKLDTGQSHHTLGEALKKSGDARGAAEEFEAAYQRDPQNTTYRTDYETTSQN